MLKVKKKIQNPKSQNNDELTDLQNQIKNSIKNLFIKDQKNKKTINGYADLITKIRNEYVQLQKENNQLKIELQKYQQYVQNVSQNPYRKPSYVRPKRKWIQYYDESDESDSYILEVRKRPRKSQKRKIIYEDDFDGIPYEPDSPTEGEDQEDDIYEVQNNKSKEKQPKQINPIKNKKGITKSIKM